MDQVISDFTKLQEEKKFTEAHTLITDAIKNNGKDNVELYWRQSLICRDIAMNAGKSDKGVYKKYVLEGLEAAENGLKIDPKHPKCHCWCAIHLNYASGLEGINKQIESSFKMKEHWLKAIEANPQDAITLHCLGRWCFEVTDLSWIKRNFAKAFFSSPPTSTYDEALKYLLESEKVSPLLLAKNSMFLAKTYSRLKKGDIAKQYCEKVMKFTDSDLETEESKSEAEAMMKSF